ncbi:hypothetical protein HYW76_01440 [Candidatus Pacearchaeota archaeon]|nr:hypothetical protein [Candidatus Pacearchaeota archaeon]
MSLIKKITTSATNTLIRGIAVGLVGLISVLNIGCSTSQNINKPLSSGYTPSKEEEARQILGSYSDGKVRRLGYDIIHKNGKRETKIPAAYVLDDDYPQLVTIAGLEAGTVIVKTATREVIPIEGGETEKKRMEVEGFYSLVQNPEAMATAIRLCDANKDGILTPDEIREQRKRMMSDYFQRQGEKKHE